jgi:hypothetical protein
MFSFSSSKDDSRDSGAQRRGKIIVAATDLFVKEKIQSGTLFSLDPGFFHHILLASKASI